MKSFLKTTASILLETNFGHILLMLGAYCLAAATTFRVFLLIALMIYFILSILRELKI